jgi:hypothetical protein
MTTKRTNSRTEPPLLSDERLNAIIQRDLERRRLFESESCVSPSLEVVPACARRSNCHCLRSLFRFAERFRSYVISRFNRNLLAFCGCAAVALVLFIAFHDSGQHPKRLVKKPLSLASNRLSAKDFMEFRSSKLSNTNSFLSVRELKSTEDYRFRNLQSFTLEPANTSRFGVHFVVRLSYPAWRELLSESHDSFAAASRPLGPRATFFDSEWTISTNLVTGFCLDSFVQESRAPLTQAINLFDSNSFFQEISKPHSALAGGTLHSSTVFNLLSKQDCTAISRLMSRVTPNPVRLLAPVSNVQPAALAQ